MQRVSALTVSVAAVMSLIGVVCTGGTQVVTDGGPEVMVAFRQAVSLPPGSRLTLHVEMPTGQRFRFPFRQLSEPEKQKLLAASESERVRARREDVAPSPAPAAGSDHAHSGSSKASANPSPAPEPSPAAGSTHAGSGSDHAGSHSAKPSVAAPVLRRPVLAASRQLGSHAVAVGVLPALVTGETGGPAFVASVALHACPEDDYFASEPGRCPFHRRSLSAGPVSAFEGAAVLETGGQPVNVRLQLP